MKQFAALAAVAALTVAACSGDDAADPAPAVTAAPDPAVTTAAPSPTTTAPDAGTPATSAAPAPSTTTADTTPATGPVTVSHVYGETVIESLPERIVSLNMQWTDVLTALGHTPVAAGVDPFMGDWYPWQHNDNIEKIEIGADNSIPFELVATYAPDLIVASWVAGDDATYATLSAIAPTIPLLGDRTVDPWEEITLTAGEIFGESAAAEGLLAEADDTAAVLLERHPGLDGKTYALANYVPGDQIYIVADPDDGASQLFAKLGMQIDPELLALDQGGFGRAELSLENIDQLDADVLLMLTNGADTADIPGYANLPAVQTGAVVVMDYPLAVAFNTPTPLSIQYSLDYIGSALEAAAGS